MTLGMDFYYTNALTWFKNLDKLIYYVNKKQEEEESNNSSMIGVNAFYSTTSCYVNGLHSVNASWPVKSDDFLPYANKAHAFWTGYFTSRPTLKYMVKYASNLLQVVRHLGVLGGLRSGDAEAEALRTLERAMAVLQHHDAVSGTEKQAVSDDYTKQLSKGIDRVEAYLQKVRMEKGLG